MWRKVLLLLLSFYISLMRCQFFNCHDDAAFEPEEGTLQDVQFTWLGALQYIHVRNGNPHYFRVPRVILISRQFVLSTAVDAAQVPEGYALGNVVFGNYERDEEECKVTIKEIASGAECEPAVLLMPIADVLLHPEYKHFGAEKSIAILKLIIPVKSKYMLPVCLPLKNYVRRSNGKQPKEKLYHVDFTSDVPRDFAVEEKEVTRLSLLPRELCDTYEDTENSTRITKDRIVCSTGCGLHSGAPSMVHEHTGHWSIAAITQGGSTCPDPLLPRRPPSPPMHTLLQPYVPWITVAITGNALRDFAEDDPFGFAMPRATTSKRLSNGWVGHWWMGGIRCYDRGDAAEDMFKFYHEIFQIKPATETSLSYYIQLETADGVHITCVKVGMPYQLGNPKLWDLDTSCVKIHVPLIKFKSVLKFEVEAWGHNTTISEPVNEISSEEEG